MSTEPVIAETLWEKISLFFDKVFKRTVEVKCEFCKTSFLTYRILYKKSGEKSCCSENCAKIMLRYF